MLEARSLTRRFHGITAVEGVSLTLHAGEVVGYLGPNGSGKSTTLKMLTGLLEPSSGVVLFRGHDISRDVLAYRQRLGYVPEEPNLYTFQSPTEYLDPIAGLRALPSSARTKAGPLLELLGLSHAADQDMSTFSKGMKQKVMLAAALLHNPDVVILDEPDSGLDITATLLLRHLVRALSQQGKAVLYSSHVLELVEKACSRVIVIHNGRVVADDSVEGLRDETQSPSLEAAFSRLALRSDPAQTAAEIAYVVTDQR